MAKVRQLVGPGRKKCPKCGEIKELDEFSGGYCRVCNTEYHRDYGRMVRQRDGEYKELKQEVVSHYGGKCEICGETDLTVLTIRPGGKFLERIRRLKKQGFPPGYRVLCLNCDHREVIKNG